MDALLARGLRCLYVLDVAGAAIRRAQARLGPAAADVTWYETDVTAEWSVPSVDIWHDRAVFHFLTAPEDRARYLDRLRQALKVNGSAIIATFALDGPERCSGLPVQRYSPETLGVELGDEFQLVDEVTHEHQTPSGATQRFIAMRFVRVRCPDGLIPEARKRHAAV